MGTFYKRLFLGLALLSSAGLTAQNNKGAKITITDKGLKEGSMCLLACYYGDKNYIKDSAKSNAKGEIVFSSDEKYPEGIYLFVQPNKKYFDFVMDSGQNFSLETDTTDFIRNMKVKGSEENKFFFEYNNFMAVKQKQIEPLRERYKKIKDSDKDSAKILSDRMSVIDKEVVQYKKDFMAKYPKTFVAKIFDAMTEIEIPEAPVLPNGRKDSTFAYRYYKSHFFDHIDFSDDRLLRTPIFHNKMVYYLDKLTPQTPDSINISTDYVINKARANKEVFKYVVNWITYNYESSKIMGMDAVFVHVVRNHHMKGETDWIDSTQLHKITKRVDDIQWTLIGKKAYPISGLDSLGKELSLYGITSKYTVVVFWDHGCGHCKKEIPELAELYHKTLKAKGVTVFAFETEENPKEWKKFIKEHNLDWINVWQSDQYKRAVVKKAYDIYSTPVIYLLDENKIIKAKRLEPKQLEQVIDALEKEKANKK